MEHKGIEYHVLLTANPTGWKWIVHLKARAKTGVSYSREAAIFNAERIIDRKAENRNPVSLSESIQKRRKERVMLKQRDRHTAEFDERLAAEAAQLREKAQSMPVGRERDEVLH
jgi:hypothetical protein